MALEPPKEPQDAAETGGEDPQANLAGCIEQYAKSGLNYLLPDRHSLVLQDFATVLVVTGLLISGTYHPVYADFKPQQRPCPGAPSKATCGLACSTFTWFTLLNYLAFVFALAAAGFSIFGTFVVRHAKLQPWPSDWDQVHPPLDVISSQNLNEPGFVKVDRYARALNYIWHARVHGLMPEPWQWRLRMYITFAWSFLTMGFVLVLGAATVAMEHQVQGCSQLFPRAVLGSGGPVVLFITVCLLHRLLTDGPLMGCMKHVPLLGKVCATGPLSIGKHTATLRGALLDAIKYNSICNAAHDIFNTGGKARQLSGAGVWPAAIRLARRDALFNKERFDFTSKPALDLQAHMADSYAAITPILDELAAWKQKHGEYYATKVFLDSNLVSRALKYRAELEKFWDVLQRKVDSGDVSLEEFFTTGSQGPVWLGRARYYRGLAEQLDIVNWYYFDKHNINSQPGSTDPRRHYCDGLDNGDINVTHLELDEYHDEIHFDELGQPIILEARKRELYDEYKFGVYEEWLVKASYCRPERYRLIQEWEMRDMLTKVCRVVKGGELHRGAPCGEVRSLQDVALVLLQARGRLLLRVLRSQEDRAEPLLLGIPESAVHPNAQSRAGSIVYHEAEVDGSFSLDQYKPFQQLQGSPGKPFAASGLRFNGTASLLPVARQQSDVVAWLNSVAHVLGGQLEVVVLKEGSCLLPTCWSLLCRPSSSLGLALWLKKHLLDKHFQEMAAYPRGLQSLTASPTPLGRSPPAHAAPADQSS